MRAAVADSRSARQAAWWARRHLSRWAPPVRIVHDPEVQAMPVAIDLHEVRREVARRVDTLSGEISVGARRLARGDAFALGEAHASRFARLLGDGIHLRHPP